MGMPLFQEQAMRLAIVAAKFTADEANGLRRAMATFRHVGTIGNFREKFVSRMIARGYADPARLRLNPLVLGETVRRRGMRLLFPEQADHMPRNGSHPRSQARKPACTWSWWVSSLNHCGADPSR